MSQLIDALRSRLGELSRQEAAVAQVVLASPHEILQLSVGAVAERAGVSQPTVIRLCRNVGCEGFADFKLRLAQSLASGAALISANVTLGDEPAIYVGKVFDTAIRALQTARNQLDVGAVAEAVALLTQPRRIVVFGMGGSAATAYDAQHKLSRFRTPCQAASDPLLARMMLVGMGPGDVLLVLSNTGRTIAVLELAGLAREQGVSVIAITAPGSPLTDWVDVALGVEPVEDAEVLTPMASRMVHLAVIDVLSTGVALRLGPVAQEVLGAVKEALRATRVSPELPVEEG